MRIALALLLLCACSAAADGAPTWRLAGSGAELHLRLHTAQELQADAAEAAKLWARASAGAFTYEFVAAADADTLEVRLAAPFDCESEASWGCTVAGQVWVSDSEPQAYRVGTLTHELGHVLGLEHTDSGLMNPRRPLAERAAPCVAASDLAAAGLTGEGACL